MPIDLPAKKCRSIPACAGEPPVGTITAASDTLYPRVCGGTTWAMPGILPMVGLSPRVRGNPVTPRPYPRCLRSIPACAGEPRQV